VRDPKGNITVFDAPGSGIYEGSETIPVSINIFGVITGYCWDGVTTYGGQNAFGNPPQPVLSGFLRDPKGNITVFAEPGSI